jgi:hypothetical protein
MIKSALAAMTIFLAGCATTPVDQTRYRAAQSSVTIADALTPQEATNLRDLGSVRCEARAVTPDDAAAACRNELKSKAADKWANLVVIGSRKLGRVEKMGLTRPAPR